MNHARCLVLATLALALGGCGPRHIGPFTPRQRHYEPGAYAQVDPVHQPSVGSLFSDGVGGFLEDTRAVRVGDLVVIQLDEDADATGESSTSLKRDNKLKLGIEAVLGIVPAIQKAYPSIDPTKLLAFLTESDFKGEGDTKRRGTLSGSIAVRVVKEMPNGDLYLEGTKVMLINNEEYHLYLSGLTRPSDIGPDNTVQSTRIADAQIEFTGRGDIADQQRKGWLSRTLDDVNPL
jgi:flagellar L-ring protein precursor FlgH